MEYSRCEVEELEEDEDEREDEHVGGWCVVMIRCGVDGMTIELGECRSMLDSKVGETELD